MVTVVGAASRVVPLLSVFALPALSGCAELLDIPSTDTLELAPSGPWRCLDAPAQPVAPAAPRAKVRFQACDSISECTTPVTNLTARLCDKLDIGCNTPRVDDVRDRGGVIDLEVPTGPSGFEGYLQVSTPVAPCFDTTTFGAAAEGLLCQLAPECDPASPTAACDTPVYVPVLWFFNPPVVSDVEQAIPLELYPSAALPLVLDAAGGEFVPGTGAVFLTVLDCDGRPASGITLEVAEHEEEAYPLYFDSGVISNTASQTDSTGVGGFIRIPPGFVEVTGVTQDGVTVGKVGVQANATFVTYTVLTPTPGL
jgi:hypothetical protein